MAIPTFTVTEVRVAATCPRISYFDAEHTRRNRLATPVVTRLWKAGDAAETACGTLFHHAVESFNRRARDAAPIREALESHREPEPLEQALRTYLNIHCIDRETLAKRPVPQQQAFIRATGVYMRELADILADALGRGREPDALLEELFGDRRRKVDVSFPVGPKGEPVRVTGILDYVFHDARHGRDRIIDYKLTPASEPANDLFQVALYALMHHTQHRTQPDVAVLYLHPERRVVSMTWEQVESQRHKLYDLLASMATWREFDERTGRGLRPPGEPSQCASCRWDRQDACLTRLGPKHEGRRLTHWTDARNPSNDPSPTPDPAPTPVSTPSPPLPPGPRPPSSITHQSSLQSLRIGTSTRGNAPVDLPADVLTTHVAVVGAAGSGKTWMAKVVAEEAIRIGVPVLAIDPQGDIAQFLRPATLTDAGPFEEQRQEFRSRAEPRVWTPGSSHARRLSLAPFRLCSREELAGVGDAARREEEWRGMLSSAASQVVSLAKLGGEVDSQKAFLFRILERLVETVPAGDLGLDAVMAATLSPESAGIDDPDRFIKKSEREKLGRKLNALLEGPAADLYSGGEPLDLDQFCRPTSPGKTPLNVIYLNALPDDGGKQGFLASLAAEVYRWMITSPAPEPGRPRLLFYIDEARDFIPAGGSKPPAKDPLIRLFTQGRKYGVACLLCTQSPRSVDYGVFGNCSTKLIGRIEAAQDMERVAEWFARQGAVPPWVSARKGAEAGTFVGRWPGMPLVLDGQPFRSRPLFSLHEGAWSPEQLEAEHMRIR